VPIILGVEETIDGASLEWFADRGIVSLAVEGGQHVEPATVANHEAVLWRILDYLRMLPASTNGRAAIDLPACASRLAKAVGSAPPIVEIVHRRGIAPDDGFVMEPGFVNFQPTAKGALLARDRAGEIRAPHAALVMLPLYQKLGDDGFFLARTVRPFWLHLAAWLRALRFDRLVGLLPGVRRDRDNPNRILVDPRVARWFVTEVFHLLGFRKRRQQGGKLAFTRRTSAAENGRLGR
jgi:succinylglutamate desuccinylase